MGPNAIRIHKHAIILKIQIPAAPVVKIGQMDLLTNKHVMISIKNMRVQIDMMNARKLIKKVQIQRVM